MAIRKKGSRSIVVNDTTFRWFFSPKAGNAPNSTLSVCSETSFHNTLIITCLEYNDSWALFSLDKTKQVTIIGPKFVSEAIAWGLANGWVPTTSGAPMKVDYEAGKFSLH